MRTTARELLATGRMIDVAAVFNPLSALSAQDLGFEGIYIPGGVTAMYTHGVSDGNATPTEVIEQVRRTREIVETPMFIRS